jgi:hypothetical protein
MTETKTARSGLLAAAEFGKHFARHKVAKGQDCWQSGCGCFCGGQQGMPSAMLAMSSVAVIDTPPIAAADGVTIGTVRRLRIARIESKRGSVDRIFTIRTFHKAKGKERTRRSNPRAAEGADCRNRSYLPRAVLRSEP